MRPKVSVPLRYLTFAPYTVQRAFSGGSRVLSSVLLEERFYDGRALPSRLRFPFPAQMTQRPLCALAEALHCVCPRERPHL